MRARRLVAIVLIVAVVVARGTPPGAHRRYPMHFTTPSSSVSPPADARMADADDVDGGATTVPPGPLPSMAPGGTFTQPTPTPTITPTPTPPASNPCDRRPCGLHGQCSVIGRGLSPSDYVCTCDQGYQGRDCHYFLRQWGVAPLPASREACVADEVGWVDTAGFSCEAYVANSWCCAALEPNCQAEYAVGGYDSDRACCASCRSGGEGAGAVSTRRDRSASLPPVLGGRLSSIADLHYPQKRKHNIAFRWRLQDAVYYQSWM